MKRILYFALVCLLAVSVVSCSEDDDMNSTNAVVSLGSATYKYKENKGIFYIPVNVTGEQNGTIRVHVDVTSNSNGCEEDKNYIITSKDLIIPADKNSVNIEIKAVDDRIINADREFTVSIISVEGATKSGTLASAVITLIDNDNIPYDRMSGTWIVSAVDNMSEKLDVVTWETKLATKTDDSEEGYGSTITMSPWRIFDGNTYEGMFEISHPLVFTYNEKSETATVELKLGQMMCSEVILGGENENGYDLTSCSMYSATVSQTGYSTTGSVIGTVNSDFTKITFNLPLIGLLYDKNGKPYSYWFFYSNIELTRK